MYVKNFEEFIEDTWDYVSKYVVSDDYWEENNELIRELTYELYELYNKTLIKEERKVFERLTPKICGRMLETIFSTLNKYGKIEM